MHRENLDFANDLAPAWPQVAAVAPLSKESVWHRSMPRSLSAFVLTVLLVLGVSTVRPLLELWGLEPASDRIWSQALIFAGRPEGWPTQTFGQPSTPLGVPAPVPQSSDSYSFLQHQVDGSPVAYDPCEPLHFTVNPALEPPDGAQAVQEAVAQIARATGFVFVDDGFTTEAADDERPSFQPERYGDRWAPILIVWSDPQLRPALNGSVAGQGGSVAYGFADTPLVYVTGQVELDAPQLGELLAAGEKQVVLAVILHELAHVVGLDHVDDPAQLMYPELTALNQGLAAGDLTGLSRLGTMACVPQV